MDKRLQADVSRARNRDRWSARIGYYTAAVLGGTLFVALAYYGGSAESWAAEERLAAGFLLIYALSLAGGFTSQLLFAFTLRHLAAALGWNRLWQWLALGGAAGLAVPWALARIGYLLEATYFPAAWQPAKSALMFPLMGPMMYSTQPIWLLVTVGAATAAFLHQLQRRLAGSSIS